MPVNLNKPELWKADIAQSVDFYNNWFLNFAPETYRQTRKRVTDDVIRTLETTDNLRDITPTTLRNIPGALPVLRMATAPPIARDRLIGLAAVPKNLVDVMEDKKQFPAQMPAETIDASLIRIGQIIMRLIDDDVLPWLVTSDQPNNQEIYRASTIIADRLCGTASDPIIRNEQEKRQLAKIKLWLEARGYTHVTETKRVKFDELPPGTFTFRLKVLGLRDDGKHVNIPVDAVIMPKTASPGTLPLLFEAKSAGDFANTNKRRKEEALKVSQLRRKHGSLVQYILYLCGYFDASYLGHEASEGIDWVWEHRTDDLAEFGL